MANSLDFDGRGPTDQQLVALGATVLLIAGLITGSLLLKSTGRLNDYIRVVAELTNVGDGLPARSDVKYHGLLVGAVDNVVPAAYGKPNYVHINLKPEYAKDIPSAVTARVVPSNVFAVSSVQLVDGAPSPSIRNGTRIPEDLQLSTVIFQTTISKLRDILAATGRGREDHSVGILAAVAAATNNRRGTLLNAGAQLTRVLDELNAIVTTYPGPSTVSALLDATRGLQATAPDLVDVLHDAVKPMQTLAEKHEQFRSLVTGSRHTFGVNRQAFDNHTDQLIEMSQNLTPALGVFALNSDKFVPIFTRLNRLSDKFFEEVWDPEMDTGNMRVNLALTPTYTYTRADCPRYGQLLGPSCYTAPTIAVRPDLPEVLLPQNYHAPADLAPPRARRSDPMATSPRWARPCSTRIPAWKTPTRRCRGGRGRSARHPASRGPPTPTTRRRHRRRDRLPRVRARPTRPRRRPTAATSARWAANTNVTNSARSPARVVRRRWRRNCCWARWRAAPRSP
ncbi:mce related family protein [Mycobacterium intracellulare]|nr:mce related family protein [Mycobacterium intracellulare]